MVESKRGLVLATCFLSGAASIISLVSLATQGWVYSDIKLGNLESASSCQVNYGLFGGTYSQSVGVSTKFDLTISCSYGNNICAALCSENSDRRSEILDQLYHEGKTDWSAGECVGTSSQTYLMEKNSEFFKRWFSLSSTGADLRYINALAHLFTIIFLTLSALVGLFSAALSVWNTASNPIESYLNILGLYIYNGIAFGSLLISFLLWGIMFFISLADNAASIFVLAGKASTLSVSLGWSYWINIVSLLMYAGSIGLLYTRSYLVSKEPAQQRVEMQGNTPAEILLF